MAKIIVSTKVGMQVEILRCDKPIADIVKILEKHGATIIRDKEEK